MNVQTQSTTPVDVDLRDRILGWMASAADDLPPQYFEKLSQDPLACLLGMTILCMAQLSCACELSGITLKCEGTPLLDTAGRLNTTPEHILAFARMLMASGWQPPAGFPATREQMETALREMLED